MLSGKFFIFRNTGLMPFENLKNENLGTKFKIGKLLGPEQTIEKIWHPDYDYAVGKEFSPLRTLKRKFHNFLNKKIQFFFG